MGMLKQQLWVDEIEGYDRYQYISHYYRIVNMPFTFAGEPIDCDVCGELITSMNMAYRTEYNIMHNKCRNHG